MPNLVVWRGGVRFRRVLVTTDITYYHWYFENIAVIIIIIFHVFRAKGFFGSSLCQVTIQYPVFVRWLFSIQSCQVTIQYPVVLSGDYSVSSLCLVTIQFTYIFLCYKLDLQSSVLVSSFETQAITELHPSNQRTWLQEHVTSIHCLLRRLVAGVSFITFAHVTSLQTLVIGFLTHHVIITVLGHVS